MPAPDVCEGCRNGDSFAIPFTMAFQPIVDLAARSVWGYEALVRGPAGEGAYHILSQVTDKNRYGFDQACRVKAIELAAKGLSGDTMARLSINFMPNAVYEPRACIRATLAAATQFGFNPRRLMFEFTENERMDDVGHVSNIVAEYKRMGFATALDDFGAGFAGLSLLAKFQPDIIKLDMELVRDIDASASRQAIVAGLVVTCASLGITMLAEGLESEAEAATLYRAGIRLFQGYYFARPALETLVGADRIETLGAFRAA